MQQYRITSLSALAITLLVGAGAQAATHDDAFLTGPQQGAPLDLAVGYLETHAADLGLSYTDLSDFVVSDQYTSRHNGVTHVYLQQRLGGVEVVNGLINVNVMSDGRILSLGNRFVGDLGLKANALSPSLAAGGAVAATLSHLGIDSAVPATLEEFGGPAQETRFDGSGIAHDDISAQLNYFGLDDGAQVRLVWTVALADTRNSDLWRVFVDAETGAVLDKFNLTVNDNFGAGRLASGRGGNFTAATEDFPEGCGSNCYNVFALPKESPDDGPRTIETDPADGTASPFGWHDTNGAAGAEFTDTRGNNVFAQTDLDSNNTFPSGIDVRAEGGANLEFDLPLDLADPPSDYRPFAVANLFYWNNIMHDITYHYGFDEPSGNFQENNYGNGGLASDFVHADAQDGAGDGTGCNNANFGTPSDGFNPRMQMFEWYAVPNGRLTINSPGPIAGDYAAARGCWGDLLTPPTTADIELGDDTVGTGSDGCEALVGFTPGNIALVDRGGCEFGQKGVTAENAGAVGVIVVNDLQQGANGIISMGAGVMGGSVTIPAVMIGNADGLTIRAELFSNGLPELGGGGVNGTIDEDPSITPDRDSDLDAGVIAHEYGHGISNRLTGGPGSVFCLQHPEQAGEGWSDWWTLSLFPDASDTSTTTRGVGNYVSFLPITGSGIRNFPYTTDLLVNPQTYEDIGTTNVPHGVGEIWAAMLWEMYWELVDQDGFDADLYGGTGGNNTAIQLVMDGLKMQPCSPTFVHARDGILAADTANNGGANVCLIWEAFAKRGLGFSATAGGTGVGDETEAFDLPPSCTDLIFEDGFESGNTSAWNLTHP